MLLQYSFKHVVLKVFSLLADIIKNHFLCLFVIFAVYTAANFAVYKYLSNFILGHDSAVFYDIFMIVAQLSFVYAVFSLFSVKKFLFKKIFPSIRFSFYSLILAATVFVFVFPFTLLAKFITISPIPFADLAVTYFSGFVKALAVTGVLFSIFNFIEKPSIEQPVLNALDIFGNNKLFISAVSVITAALFIYIPVLSEKGYAFVFRMFFCIVFMAVYFALKPGENGEAVEEREDAKNPQIKISI
jgi:hypothetical protein